MFFNLAKLREALPRTKLKMLKIKIFLNLFENIFVSLFFSATMLPQVGQTGKHSFKTSDFQAVGKFLLSFTLTQR